MTSGVPWPVWAGVASCVIALFSTIFSLLLPRPVQLPIDRRRPNGDPSSSALTGATAAAGSMMERLLRRGGVSRRLNGLLARAGVAMRLQDVALLLMVGTLVLGTAGATFVRPLVGLVLAALVPLGVKLYLSMLIGRRERAFADQLDDSLQLMSSSLRAGHSLMQALAAVASEAEQPTSEEFARIINETRVGRELGQSLDEAARRMNSQDFVWVTQAVAINREVGGNLAEVLDGVSHTIRERNQIRRQVKALAAEGKLSAIVLMLLPFGIIGFLLLTNRAYVMKFGDSVIGYGMLATAVVLLVVGGVWLSKTVQVKF